MRSRSSSLVKTVSFLLIFCVVCTQNLLFAGESLTATLAAQNSNSVRSELRKEMGFSSSATPSFNESNIGGLRLSSVRSELRQIEIGQISFNFVQIAIGFGISLGSLILIQFVYRAFLLKWVQVRRFGEGAGLIINLVTDRLRLRYGIDSLIELKWLDLKNVALYLAKSKKEENHFSDKFDLLIDLIIRIRQLLEPDAAGIGYKKAIETGRGRMTYDILPLLEQAWKQKQAGGVIRIELQPYSHRGVPTYIPFLVTQSVDHRSELRSISKVGEAGIQQSPFLSLAREVIGRLVEVRRDIAGIKLNLEFSQVVTQYREKDIKGVPESAFVQSIANDWPSSIPKEIDGHSIKVIDIIPSEEFVIGLIRRDEMEIYAQELSNAIHKLFDSAGIDLIRGSLAKNDRKTFRIPGAPQFEVRAGRYPNQNGIYLNIFIHPEIKSLSADFRRIAFEMLRRFSDGSSTDQMPESVDLLLPNAERDVRTSLVSVYPVTGEYGTIRLRYERRFVETGPETLLMKPITIVSEDGSLQQSNLRYVGLHFPQTGQFLSMTDMIRKGFDTELASILSRVNEFKVSIEPGKTTVARTTQHFRVTITRFRDGSTYAMNIYFSNLDKTCFVTVKRSELRLADGLSHGFLQILRQTSVLNRVFELAKYLSDNRESNSAFIVSRELAFDRGLLPVFAAMAKQGIPVAIIAPSADIDRDQLIASFNRELGPNQKLVARSTLHEAATSLSKRAGSAHLIFVRGQNEIKIASEIDFEQEFGGRVVEMSDRAIQELRMSVRGLTNLMQQVVQIYNYIHQSA